MLVYNYVASRCVGLRADWYETPKFREARGCAGIFQYFFTLQSGRPRWRFGVGADSAARFGDFRRWHSAPAETLFTAAAATGFGPPSPCLYI